MGPMGAVSLNDLAVAYAMDNYFKVAKKDKLGLSLQTRKFYSEILKVKKESDES